MGVLQEGVLLQDADLTVLEANTAAEILFGAHEGGLVGGPDPVHGAVDEDHRPIAADATPAAMALATGQTHSGQVIGVNPADTGPLRWFSVNAAPGSAFGLALAQHEDGFVFATVDDTLNVLDIWRVK